MIVEYDLTDEVLTIAAALRDGGRLRDPRRRAVTAPSGRRAASDLGKQLRREARS